MRFALIVPNWAPYDQELMVRAAEEAEQLGYEHLFFTDHLMNPYAASQGFPEETVETWALIAHLAARTERIRLGTAVTPISLRPPALLAKQVATIDRLSGGRIDVGVGTGWSAGSYGVLDAGFGDPASRKARLREGIDLILRLWTEDRVTLAGEHYAAQDAIVAPKPLQRPHPPLWVGGWRRHMLQLTAELGQGWLPWNRPVEVYGACLEQIRAQASTLGRADEIVLGTAMLVVPDRLADARLAMVHGDQPNVTRSRLTAVAETYEEAGAELFAMLVFPPEDVLDIARHVARVLL
jgi:probable F420-dependent oxidoreductase